MKFEIDIKEIQFTLKNNEIEIGPLTISKCSDGLVLLYGNDFKISEEVEKLIKEFFKDIFKIRSI